jgi:branched-chain amino acid transport system substrate-binding protein
MRKLLLLVFGILLFFSGCENKNSTTKSTQSEKINVGVLLPLTGNGALYGKYVKDGALLAISELNSTRYNVTIEDTKTTSKDGISSANKLILKDNVPIIIGPMSSSVANSVGKICQSKKVIMITTASAPSISTLGNYIYRIYPSDSYDGSFLAQQIIKQNLLKSIVIYLNNDFGAGMVKVFEETYKKEGGRIIDKFAFEPNQQDFTILVSKIKEKKIDNLFIIATQKEYISIINNMENINIKDIPIFTPVNIEDKVVTNAISSAMLNKIQYSKPVFDLDNNSTAIQNSFKKLWSKVYKEKPNIFNAYGYDSIKLIDKMITETKDNQYKATLDSFNELHGATGTYKFDKNGDVIRNFSLLKLKDL